MDAKEKIKEGVQLYFDSMYESDSEKVRQAFHPNAMITGYLETGLAEMTVDEFAEFVESAEIYNMVPKLSNGGRIPAPTSPTRRAL